MSLMLPTLNRNFIGRPALSTVTLIFVVLPPLLFLMCCVSPFLRPSLVGGESRLHSSWTAFFVSSAKVSVNTVPITKLRGQSAPRASSFQHPFNAAESKAQIKTRSSLFLTTIRVWPIRHRLIHSSFYFPQKIFYHTLSTAPSSLPQSLSSALSSCKNFSLSSQKILFKGDESKRLKFITGCFWKSCKFFRPLKFRAMSR